MKFWEKTVEYAFVLQTKDIDFVAPLAGLEEHAAGDAVFGKDERLSLVEFKVDKDALSSEKSLFKNYDFACETMRSRDFHHFLVFADQTPKVGERLPTLVIQTYFSCRPVLSAKAAFQKGVSPELFRKYIGDLFELKMADGRSSGGQINPLALANVVGVAPNGKTSTVTLYDYAVRMFPELIPQPAVEVAKKIKAKLGQG